MGRQLNASCNFNTGYLICDILNNTMEVVVKIKMTFGKHSLVEDRERRTVKYRLWEKCTQPLIGMETAARRVPLRFRRVRKEATDSGSSSDSGTWINMGHALAIHPQFQLTLAIPSLAKMEEKSSLKSLLNLILRTM